MKYKGFPKSKKTFFKDNSNGKKAFPGGLKGPKQPKYHGKRRKLKQVKQEAVKTPKQLMTQSPNRVAQKRQEHLVGKPRQFKPSMGWESSAMTMRIRRATS